MFNALKYIEELEKAGFTKVQSEASVKLLIDTMNENFALKSDLKETEVVLRSDMKEMESSIRSDMKEMEHFIRSDMQKMESSLRSDIQFMGSLIKELEYKLTIKLGSVMAVSIGVAVSLVKLISS